MGSGEPAGAMQEGGSQGVEFLEGPESGSLSGGLAAGRGGGHLEFTGQVVGEEAGEEIELVAGSPGNRDVVQLAVGFEFAEYVFL